jgi:glutathione peroxidase
MRLFKKLATILLLISSVNLLALSNKELDMSIYDFSVKTIDGKDKNLQEYKDSVLLIVNVASECGLTPQYSQLVELYEKYKDRGFYVLGFPSDNFLNQEFSKESEIKEFCDINFKVTFPLFSKVDVNGKNTHQLFKYLKTKKSGFLGTEFIKWNFTKFLVDKNGEVVKRYSPIVQPRDIAKDIEELF